MENNRYERLSLIDWFPNESVRNSTYAVIGAGATGNEVIKNLTLLGVERIDIFDYDEVELHNLTRTVLLRESDVGEPKALCTARRARELDPNVDVRAFCGDFWKILSLDQLSEYDFVIACVDNVEARIKLNQLCRLASTNFINTGIDSRFAVVEFFPFSAQVDDVPCFECGLAVSAYERLAERYSCGRLRRLSYAEGKLPTTIITASLVGAMTASTCLQSLNGSNRRLARRIMVDSLTGSADTVELSKNEHCIGCMDKCDNVCIVTMGSGAGEARIPSEIFSRDDLSVFASEGIVTEYTCVKCGDQARVFQLAEKFDETLAECPDCKIHSRDVEVKAQFELGELLRNYSDKVFPAKFMRLEVDEVTFVLDFTTAVSPAFP